MRYTREDLISICKDAIVPYSLWGDRDSYSAQINVASIYKGLMANLSYTVTIDEDGKTIWITFKKPTKKQRNYLMEHYLEVDSREDYFKEFGEDCEMFDGYGIDWDSSYLCGYLPTPERLKMVNGEDWY